MKLEYKVSAKQALQRLKDGNEKYLSSKTGCGDISPEIRKHTCENGQQPYAVIVTCSDSRVMYIDGEPFGDMDIERVVMTPEVGFAKGDMRRLVLYCRNGNTDRYDFGFRADRSGFPGYAQLVEAVKENFNDKFAYDVE